MSSSVHQLPQTQITMRAGLEVLIQDALASETALAATPAHLRAAWLEDTAADVLKHQQQLAEIIVCEGIKTIREAHAEVKRASYTLKLCAEEARRSTGSTIAFDQVAQGEGRTGWTEMRPVGLVVAITPFNDPLNLVAHKVGPAIAAGCPVIVKPHAATAGVAHKLRELFIKNGMPEHYYQVSADTSTDAGRYLVEHPGVKMLSFTGGKNAGVAIARAAAGRPVSLELGGVCSTIVLADANLDTCASALVSGMYAAAGQNCLHVQRLMISDAVYETMLDRLVALSAEVVSGDPMSEQCDMGALIDDAAVARCHAFIKEAIALGGRLVCGGRSQGKIFEPTILADVPPQARICREEVFGPVTVVEKITGLEQAIALLSEVEASLAVAIFTQSLAAPFALRAIRAGSIIVNDSTDFRIDAMPFGGPFPAGLSREGVRDAMRSMSETQLFCLKFN